jgi:hypothetical protein
MFRFSGLRSQAGDATGWDRQPHGLELCHPRQGRRKQTLILMPTNLTEIFRFSYPLKTEVFKVIVCAFHLDPLNAFFIDFIDPLHSHGHFFDLASFSLISYFSFQFT